MVDIIPDWQRAREAPPEFARVTGAYEGAWKLYCISRLMLRGVCGMPPIEFGPCQFPSFETTTVEELARLTQAFQTEAIQTLEQVGEILAEMNS